MQRNVAPRIMIGTVWSQRIGISLLKYSIQSANHRGRLITFLAITAAAARAQ